MRLFKRDGYNLVISDEAYALKAFRQIWNRDKSLSKERAITELGYCYFMEDSRSDYKYIIDEQERKEAIKQGEGMKDNWEPDTTVKEAQALYASFKTTSELLLDDTRMLVEKYRMKLRSMDLAELDIKETKELGTIIKLIPSMVKDLDEAERAIAKELAQNDRVRGAQEKAIYEDL